jgi:TonB family protein
MKKLLLVILLGVLVTGLCFAMSRKPNTRKPFLHKDSGDSLNLELNDKQIIPIWDGDDVEPINPIAPIYPPEAVKAGITGTVILEVDVSKDGTIKDIKVKKSAMAGPGGLDEAAINAVKQWDFSPGKLGRKAIDETLTIPIEFTITKEKNTDKNQIETPEPAGMFIKGIFTKDKHLYDKTPESINPAYPEIEIDRNQLKDLVIIEVKVDNEGNPKDFKVYKSGPGDLDEFAITAVKELKFKPAMKDGKPVEASVIIPIEFKYERK